MDESYKEVQESLVMLYRPSHSMKTRALTFLLSSKNCLEGADRKNEVRPVGTKTIELIPHVLFLETERVRLPVQTHPTKCTVVSSEHRNIVDTLALCCVCTKLTMAKNQCSSASSVKTLARWRPLLQPGWSCLQLEMIT